MKEKIYTHEEMVELCDESKRMIIEEFESMLAVLPEDASGSCFFITDILRGIDKVKSGNGIETNNE